MNEYAAIRQEVCPDVLAMVEEAKQALTEAGTKLLTLKRRLDEVSHEQADLLDMLLSNMADADLNARMKALTDEKASLKEQILETQRATRSSTMSSSGRSFRRSRSRMPTRSTSSLETPMW